MRNTSRLCTIAAAFLAFLPSAEAQYRARSDSSETPLLSFRLGAFAEGTDAAIEVSSIRTSGNPDPSSTDTANHRIDYSVRHVFLGVRGGVHFAPSSARGLEVDVDALVGSLSTALSESIHSLSIHEPQASDQEKHNTSMDEGDLAYGFHLGAWYGLRQALDGLLRIGVDYQFLTGEATFNDERFFGDLIDGDYSFRRHRLTLLCGTQVGSVRPYIGIGFLFYEANLDIEEADDANPRTWEADFEAEDTLFLRLGVEVAGDRLSARADLHLRAEWGFGVMFALRI